MNTRSQPTLISSSSYSSFSLPSSNLPPNLPLSKNSLNISPANLLDQSPSNLPTKVAARKLQHINCIFERSEGYGGLYIGDTISTLKNELLAQNKIQAVLCCNDEAKNHLKKFPLIQRPRFRHIPIQDNQKYPIFVHFPEALQFIEEERTNNRNVLIQCHAGVSRSGTFLCAYIMWKKGWTLNQTYQFVLTKRPRIKPNEGFWEQLLKYQNTVLKIGSVENSEQLMSSHKEKQYESSSNASSENTKNNAKSVAQINKQKCGLDMNIDNPEMHQKSFNGNQRKNQFQNNVEKKKLPNLYSPNQNQMVKSPSHHNYPMTMSLNRNISEPVFEKKPIPSSFFNSPVGISPRDPSHPAFFMTIQNQYQASQFANMNNNFRKDKQAERFPK